MSYKDKKDSQKKSCDKDRSQCAESGKCDKSQCGMSCRDKKDCQKRGCEKDKSQCAMPYKGKKKCGDYSCDKKTSSVGLALVKGFDNGIKGSVSFEKVTAESKRKVQLVAQIEGLKPNQKFGFHIHELGNCESKGVLAGGHFNPKDQKHGGLKSKKRHLGDLGNLKSDKEGKATMTALIEGKLKMFMGRSLIIHEAQDDLKSQPTGNSGKRIACGIIGVGLSPVKVK